MEFTFQCNIKKITDNTEIDIENKEVQYKAELKGNSAENFFMSTPSITHFLNASSQKQPIDKCR